MKKLISAISTTALLVSIVVFAPSSKAANSPEVVWASSATATTHYTGYEPSFAAGAPDATRCGDYSGQAWTYGNPKVESELEVVFDEPLDATAIRIYFSNDYIDLFTIHVATEGAAYTPFTSLNGNVFTGSPLYCDDNADSEYPNNIKAEIPIDFQNDKIEKVKFIFQTAEGWPEIDAIGLVKDIYTKPAFTSKPAIFGKAKVGKELGRSFETSGNPFPSYTSQWFSCTKPGSKFVTKRPADCTAIPGAKYDVLKLKTNHKGKFIRARITIKNAVGSVTFFSKTTAKVS